MTEHVNGQPDDGMETEVGTIELLSGAGALEAVDRASIDIQIATAHRYPRSVDKSLKEALTLATLDEETAASMFYVLPRGGKKIEGPAARLAEVMAYTWGNLRVDADIVAEDRTTVTAMGTCFDLEKNVAMRVRVKRRITTKHGKRYDDDMIGVTSNAAISIALRNCVFKVIPQALVRRVYEAAREASVGKGGTMAQKRQNALEWFAKVGVAEAQVFDFLEIRGLDDMTLDHLVTLRGLKTAIKDGETTVEQAFARHTDGEGADELNDALGGSSAAPPEPADETKPATKSQMDSLRELRKKAREAGVLDSAAEEEIEAALEAKTEVVVTAQARAVSRMLLQAEGAPEQPSMV